MPAAPIIIEVAVAYGAEYYATAAVGAEILGSTLLADAATGAIAGAAAGAAGAAVSGGNIGKGALKGGEGGAVGGTLFGPGGLVPGADTGSQAVNAGITGAERGATSALVAGKGVKGALQQGAVGGAVGAIGNALSPQGGNRTTADDLVSGVGKGLASSELSSLFAPQQSSQTSSPTATPAPVDASAPTVGSSVLGQALGTQGPSLTALFGSSSDKANQRPVWNQESLRVKDSTGTENG